MQYGDNVLAVGDFSFFGGNDFGDRRYYQNMAVNRHIAGTAHQGGNFTAGKMPTTTLLISSTIINYSLRHCYAVITHCDHDEPNSDRGSKNKRNPETTLHYKTILWAGAPFFFLRPSGR